MAQERPKVVIVGAGFGGLVAAKTLARAPVDVTLIDRQNYHCFQPLLYQVATASLATSEIAWPIRHLLRRRQEVTTLFATVGGIDAAGKRTPVPPLLLETEIDHQIAREAQVRREQRLARRAATTSHF